MLLHSGCQEKVIVELGVHAALACARLSTGVWDGTISIPKCMCPCTRVLAPIHLQVTDYFERDYVAGKYATLFTGLLVFTLLFAINSATHSYLVMRWGRGLDLSRCSQIK